MTFKILVGDLNPKLPPGSALQIRISLYAYKIRISASNLSGTQYFCPHKKFNTVLRTSNATMYIIIIRGWATQTHTRTQRAKKEYPVQCTELIIILFTRAYIAVH